MCVLFLHILSVCHIYTSRVRLVQISELQLLNTPKWREQKKIGLNCCCSWIQSSSTKFSVFFPSFRYFHGLSICLLLKAATFLFAYSCCLLYTNGVEKIFAYFTFRTFYLGLCIEFIVWQCFVITHIVIYAFK